MENRGKGAAGIYGQFRAPEWNVSNEGNIAKRGTFLILKSAEGRTRTGTGSPPLDFESSASTTFTTSAQEHKLHNHSESAQGVHLNQRGMCVIGCLVLDAGYWTTSITVLSLPSRPPTQITLLLAAPLHLCTSGFRPLSPPLTRTTLLPAAPPPLRTSAPPTLTPTAHQGPDLPRRPPHPPGLRCGNSCLRWCSR